MKGEKHIAPMDFAECFRKPDVSENSKVFYDRFLRNRNDMYNILKILPATGYWSRDEGGTG